jgi:hypothetical protein
VANSNRNGQPNRAHHQVCIEHLCSNLCRPGLNPTIHTVFCYCTGWNPQVWGVHSRHQLCPRF